MTGLPDEAFWRGRRVLVTGHTGFKGAWLTMWLRRLGASVTGFGSPPAPPSLFTQARMDELVEDLRGDVRDEGAVQEAVAGTRPAVVFHLAAQALVRRGLADPPGTYATNVLGTAHLLAAVGDSAPVVCVTSDKCYAPRTGRCREDDPLGGRDPYSASKAAQELVAAAARETGGVNVATARAGNVIGGGDWAEDRLVPDLVRATRAGSALSVRHPSAVRPWQHVLCPLAGYLLLAERLTASREYASAWNFGPDAADEVSVAALVDAWPEPVTLRVAEQEAAETGVLRLDSSRARTQLGWRPAWNLSAAIEATAAWYAEVRDGADARQVTLAQIASYERAARSERAATPARA
ncbi:MAG TPA: CDP-glucose 4,6-dehydratase [Solirubrobacteraceae bacterium]|nr:CDP-glucose 4,6-dehydratase [Solirubrobacteraceae bacterium]